jgi:hypothetical protein
MTVFNVNGVNNLVYLFSQNLWLLLIVIGAVATTVMGFKDKADENFKEEQNIL